MEERKNRTLTIRISETELSGIQAKAKEHQMNVSEYLIFKALDKEVDYKMLFEELNQKISRIESTLFQGERRK